jgi:hypothetical protein
MSQAQITITTIAPTSGLFTSFQPRSKEGEAKKLEVFASYSLPVAFESIVNDEIKSFCQRALASEINSLMRDAVKSGKSEFQLPAISELFAETKREFLITKKDLEAWVDTFAAPILSAAISSKASLHIDSPKVVKKVIAYKELLLQIASRSIMDQDDIDSCIKVLALVESKPNAYTDNVSEALARKQEKLNEYLAGKADNADDDIDF